MYKKFIKTFFDFLIALLLLILLSPFFILITLALFIANRGTPFFLQHRPGKNDKIFTIIKFKTMNDKKDATGNLLSDADRLTKIGVFIRKTSLDEIPQLLNVVNGDMSIIGPRPLLVEYLPLYNQTQKRRHQVKPGITGWAQVNGRNAISWDDKFKLDVYYVEKQNFLLDLKIILLTIKKVFFFKEITQQGQATTTKFEGS